MLLAFDGVTIQHTNYVKALKIQLERDFGIQVLLDIVDIPVSKNNSPLKWYVDNIEQSNCIGVILPPGKDVQQKRGSPYATYDLCLAQLETLENNFSSSSSQTKRKIIALTVPDSDVNMLPAVVRFVNQFALPQDIFILRHYLLSPKRIRSMRLILDLCRLSRAESSIQRFFTIYSRMESEPCMEPLFSPSNESVPDSNESVPESNSPLDDVHMENQEILDEQYGKHVPSVRNLDPVCGRDQPV